jgi:D-glutamate N-acetyltransferase
VIVPYTRPVIPSTPTPSTKARRLVILAEGNFGFHHGKTAVGVIRYGPDETVAVIDSTQAGGNVSSILPGRDIPIVATLGEALAGRTRPDTLLIGIAPTGGKLPDSWRTTILDAIRAGLDVHSGLHTFLGDDPEFAEAARVAGTRIVDYRRPPERMETAVGRRHGAGKRVILTVGTDCAIGKMSVALELRSAARAAGRSASFVPTGQTGMMIDGWGAAVDRLISDFAQGTVEWLVEEGERRGDWVIVEGQGSLDHPAYSSVTLALIHGATPQAMVLVHKAGQTEHDFDHLPDASFPIASLRPFIDLHEKVAGLVAPSKVVAIALNTSAIASEDEAQAEIRRVAEETGLPTDDPVRFGAARLWAAIEQGVDALPWA